MNKFVSGLLFFLSLATFVLGLYISIWIMLIGGIVDIVNQIKAPETNSLIIARGVANIVLFEIPIVGGIFVGLFFGRMSVYLYKK